MPRKQTKENRKSKQDQSSAAAPAPVRRDEKDEKTPALDHQDSNLSDFECHITGKRFSAKPIDQRAIRLRENNQVYSENGIREWFFIGGKILAPDTQKALRNLPTGTFEDELKSEKLFFVDHRLTNASDAFTAQIRAFDKMRDQLSPDSIKKLDQLKEDFLQEYKQPLAAQVQPIVRQRNFFQRHVMTFFRNPVKFWMLTTVVMSGFSALMWNQTRQLGALSEQSIEKNEDLSKLLNETQSTLTSLRSSYTVLSTELSNTKIYLDVEKAAKTSADQDLKREQEAHNRTKNSSSNREIRRQHEIEHCQQDRRRENERMKIETKSYIERLRRKEEELAKLKVTKDNPAALATAPRPG